MKNNMEVISQYPHTLRGFLSIIGAEAAKKIDDEYLKNNNFNIHRDWGGYGIIAPDFREYDKRLIDEHQVI